MAPFDFIRAATNTTTGLPPGYTNHGIEGLLCGPADWFSVLTFYGINYVAHCLTIKYYPAETLSEKVMVGILALLLPSSGITRALDAIKRYSRFRGVGELEQAAFAGALVMVVRNRTWIPHEGDCIRDIELESAGARKLLEHETDGRGLDKPPDSRVNRSIQDDTSAGNTGSGDHAEDIPLLPLSSTPNVTLEKTNWYYRVESPPWLKQGITVGNRPDKILDRGCKIHGLIGKLPSGYDLTYVPLGAEVRPFSNGSGQEYKYRLSSGYNIAKALLSIFQTCYAAITIYRARGDQITVFGYAAFGLTVLPYLIMSLVNFIAQVVTADYDTFYLVHSPELDEAKRRGCVFEGTTGTLIPEDSGPSAPSHYANDWALDEIWQVTQQTGLSVTVERQTKDREPLPDASLKIEGQAEKYKFNGTTLVFPFCSRFKRKLALIVSASPRYNSQHYAPHMRARISSKITIFAPMAFVGLLLAVIGGLTRFRQGSSTPLERGFILSWILVGGLMGALWTLISEVFLLVMSEDDIIGRIFIVVIALILFGAFFVPAIGGWS